MMQIRKRTLIFIIVSALVIGCLGTVLVVKSGITGSVLLTSSDYDIVKRYVKEYSKLDSIKNFLEANYYVPLDENTLIEGTYKGLVEATGDPYSEYLSVSEVDEYFASLLGTETYGGIGVTFLTAPLENGFYISSVNPSGPAYAAGIRKGGYVVSVNGKAFTEFDGDALADAIRGEVGTQVTIEVLSLDGKKEYKLTRQDIQSYSVEYSLETLENGKKCAVISISQFILSTPDEFENALTKAENEADYMVLDLRDNPGGLVDAAVSVADMLMDEGVIVKTKEQNGEGDTYSSRAGRTSLKYVVLVNNNSASSSEILSCAIQENKEGLIIGEKTYGKGIIQNTKQFSDGSVVKYTMSQYVTASGKEIHGIGITPDVEISLDDSCYNEEGLLVNDIQLERAFEIVSEE